MTLVTCLWFFCSYFLSLLFFPVLCVSSDDFFLSHCMFCHSYSSFVVSLLLNPFPLIYRPRSNCVFLLCTCSFVVLSSWESTKPQYCEWSETLICLSYLSSLAVCNTYYAICYLALMYCHLTLTPFLFLLALRVVMHCFTLLLSSIRDFSPGLPVFFRVACCALPV